MCVYVLCLFLHSIHCVHTSGNSEGAVKMLCYNIPNSSSLHTSFVTLNSVNADTKKAKDLHDFDVMYV